MGRLNHYKYAAETIKSHITMLSVITLYTPNPPPRHNRIPCPVHNGANYNLSFSDKLFHCFVCKTSGDVINFVQHIFGLGFIDALEKLNNDFSLGIPFDRRMTLREQREAQKRYDSIMAERERQEAEKQAREDKYWSVFNGWAECDYYIHHFAPTSPDEGFNTLYVKALHEIDYYDYLLEGVKAW